MDTPRLRNSCAPKGLAQVANVYAHGELYGARICKGVQLKSKSQHPGGAQHDRFAVCVIAQQYSSVIFVSLRFHFR